MKPLIFISHITAESEVAVWIKTTVRGLLLGAVDFFVSSDGTAIQGGDKWLDKIENSLKKSSVVLVLCSKSSIQQPWVNFEAGGAWMAGKRVIPICHSDLSVSSLPQPLSTLQAYVLSNQQDFRNLVNVIASQAGLNPPAVAPDILSTLPAIPSTTDILDSSSRQHATSLTVGKISIHDIAALRSNYKFDKRTGIHRHMITDEPVCTSCIMEGIESPVTESEEGWQCHRRGCNKFYSNPDFYPPGTEDMG